MDAKLSEQIESALEALRLSHTRAELVRQKMRKLGIRFGLAFDHQDEEIAQLIDKLYFTKRLAERRETADAATERSLD